MNNTSVIKRGVDLLGWVEKDTTLKRKASTNGGEWCGPCPWCGGEDRFLVWPNAEPPGWWCRQCQRGGDAIAYVMQRHNLDFRQAVLWCIIVSGYPSVYCLLVGLHYRILCALRAFRARPLRFRRTGGYACDTDSN